MNPRMAASNQNWPMTEQIGELGQEVSAFGVRIDELLRTARPHEADPLIRSALAELEAAREEIQVQQEQIQAAKRSLDDVRRSRDKLADGLPVPLLVTNGAGGVSYANPTAAELLGLLRARLVGKPLATYVSVEDRPAFRAALNMLAHGGDRQVLSLRLRRRRGSPIPVILSGSTRPQLTGPDSLHWVAIPVADGDMQVNEVAADRLIDSLLNLSLLPLADRSIHKLLRPMVVLAVRALPEVDTAVMTLDTDQGPLRAAEPASAAHVVDLEHTLREGPATTASATRLQRSGNLAGDDRWPEFGPRASALGIQSVVAIPVAPGENTRGVLMLLSQRRDAFTDDATRRCLIFAEAAAAAAAVVLERELSSHTADQLLQALRSRETIEQAKGIIMAQRRCSPEEAFQVLVQLSQRTNVKLRIIAERLVDAIGEAH
jgi:PAS domain S-box-containing protein